MQSKVSLEEQFSYSIIGVILFVIIIVAVLGYLIYIYLKYKKKYQQQKQVIIPKNIMMIKKKYLYQIDTLLVELNSNKVRSRTAYNRLSVLIRSFILEATDIDLLKSTLSEIKKKDTGILYELIKEYYEPEFSMSSKGDIKSSLDKTRKVIEEWR